MTTIHLLQSPYRMGILHDTSTLWGSVLMNEGGQGEYRSERPGLPEDAIPGYSLLACIGTGGMGTIYRAEHKMLGRQVALKVLRGQLATDETQVQRFLREMRTLATINHPNVVQCHDAGRVGELLYIVQELVSGGDSEQWVNRTPRGLPWEQAIEVGRDACAGLGALAEVNLVHRDVKPSNIFITSEGTGKIGDFGLARGTANNEDDDLTMTGYIFGTPSYMSPEQACGEELDIRSDLYALGASIFSLLTKTRPYKGRNTVDLLSKVIDDPPPDPRVSNPDIPDQVAEVIYKAMTKEVTDRYQTPAEMTRALDQLLGKPGTRTFVKEDPTVATVQPRDGMLVVEVAGAIGVDDSEFWQNLDRELDHHDPMPVVVDCSLAGFITSEGIAFLVRAHEICSRRGVGFALSSLSANMAKSLRYVRLDRLLPMMEDLAAAKQHFAKTKG